MEPKIIKDVFLTAPILRNMLIRSLHSLNVHRPALLVNHVDENGNLTEGEWRKNVTGDNFYPLQTLRSRHNAKIYAKAIRKEFIDYFITQGALEWQSFLFYNVI